MSRRLTDGFALRATAIIKAEERIAAPVDGMTLAGKHRNAERICVVYVIGLPRCLCASVCKTS